MVLGANMELYGGGERRRKVAYVEVVYSANFGNFLLFDVTGVVSLPTKRVPTYRFSTRLSTPNYTPVSPLPGATIKSDFKLGLKLMFRFAWESTDLVNEGSGYSSHVISYYFVKLGRQFATSFLYEVEISGENVSLSHYNFITRLPMPVPTSLLL